MDNVNFVIGVDKVYRLAGNNWYAVEQDDDKVMLVDTDCEVAGEKLETTWSNDNSDNGQNILDYTNTLADKFFSTIKYAIIPRDIDCKDDRNYGYGELKGAYMWPMSVKEFRKHRDIGGKIRKNSKDWVWSRTFAGCSDGGYNYCAWYGGVSGTLGDNYVTSSCAVAPAFNLSKSVIDYITEDGEIVLKSATATITND